MMKEQAFQEIKECQSTRESEQHVAKTFDLPILEQTKIKSQRDVSIRLEITLSKEQHEKLQKVRELLSHVVSDGNLPQVFEKALDEVIKKYQPKKSREKEATARDESERDGEDSKDKEKSEAKKNRKITPRTRNIVRTEDGCCQFVAKNGKRCESKWQVQADHQIPLWAGGTHERENLQSLCAQHNRRKYWRETGLRLR